MTAPAPDKVAVMQICDTLEAGGMERVAVNVANALPRDRFVSHLCTTRRDGPLEEIVAPDVLRLRLKRKSTFDAAAYLLLSAYIRRHHIAVLHAHGPSLFFAAAVAARFPRLTLVWHDHFGGFETHDRSALLYRVPARRLDGVIAVSEDLATWAEHSLGIPAGRIRFIPNFVAEPSPLSSPPSLPGAPGSRIVCVANLRAQKNHLGLFRAMKEVVGRYPAAHLLLLGACDNPAYLDRLHREMDQLGVREHITWLGVRDDVYDVLRGCDIGVLSSISEGLPLSLLEYGMAGLPAVATRVGQCAEVLAEGAAGILVDPSSTDQLRDALSLLLASQERRAHFAAALGARVRDHYSEREALRRITEVYGFSRN
jgi:glycosyltransferase involved in cell wall biosynthesis